MPNNAVFLVDTYDTLEGVRRAAAAGAWLRARGHKLAGIRLDSGDLAYLSIEARKILDAAGFPDAHIFASNDLDEHIISSLKQQGAQITVWGVGTKLVTAHDQPALGGVYKLSAIRETPGGAWQHKIKLSEQAAKITTPGVQQIRRFTHKGEFIGDMIYNEETPDWSGDVPAAGHGAAVQRSLQDFMQLRGALRASGGGDVAAPSGRTIIDQTNLARRKIIPDEATHEDLLAPIFRAGRLVHEKRPLDEIRARVQDQLAHLYAGTKRLLNPHEYPVGLDPALFDLKTRLILENRRIAA